MTLSDDLEQIETGAKKEKLLDRRLRELLAEARQKHHKVDPTKTTKAFAISEWCAEDHKGILFKQ